MLTPFLNLLCFIMIFVSFCFCCCSGWDMTEIRKRMWKTERDKILVIRDFHAWCTGSLPAFVYIDLNLLIIDNQYRIKNLANQYRLHIPETRWMQRAPSNLSLCIYLTGSIILLLTSDRQLFFFSLFIRNLVSNLPTAVQKIAAINAAPNLRLDL